MPETITLNLKIDGNFPGSSMVDWIVDRAERLDLSGGISFQNTTRIELTACGERVLVEALEVACSLGHFDAQVDSISHLEVSMPEAFYRQRRQFRRYWTQSPSETKP